MYRWHRVKMMRNKGESIKKISRQLKISRNTVRKYIRSSDPPKFKGRDYEKLLDRYENRIEKMLEDGYIGTRIYEELLKEGYRGSLSTVHRYLAEINEAKERSEKVTTRVETAPGHQMQYDWKEWRLPVGGRDLKIYVHELVLSFSRKKFYTYSLSITTCDVIRAIVSGISFFGGIALELVIDNPKQMVITHRRDGIVRYNEEFLRFCGLYGIEPSPCRTYRARTKGKVERPFYYLQEHLLRGLAVKELSEFDNLLADFTAKYNKRVHSTLKESPNSRFEMEKEHLREIPLVDPTLLFERQLRKVTNDGYISYLGNFYPVPIGLCLRPVMVESVLGREIRIYDGKGEPVCTHRLALFEKGIRPLHPEHEEINRGYREKKQETKGAVVGKFTSTFGAVGEEYIAGLRRSVGINLYWHLKEILHCLDLYSKEEIGTSLIGCIAIGAFHKNSVLRLLGPPKLPPPPKSASFSVPCYLRGTISRPLSFYAGVGEVSDE